MLGPDCRYSQNSLLARPTRTRQRHMSNATDGRGLGSVGGGVASRIRDILRVARRHAVGGWADGALRPSFHEVQFYRRIGPDR